MVGTGNSLQKDRITFTDKSTISLGFGVIMSAQLQLIIPGVIGATESLLDVHPLRSIILQRFQVKQFEFIL